MRAVVFALILCKAPVKGLPLLDPTPVPTPCVETINELDAVKTINEDDCKVWKITSLIRSLTVTSSSASAEVEDVDVTFSDARGVSGFLAVGEGGNAKATTIAAEGDIDGGVRVAARNGELGGTATSTSIIVQGAIGSAQVPRYGYLVSVLVGFGLNSNAYDTNIAAGSVGGTIEVGEDGGKATNTNIAVEGSVGEVFVGDEGGKATNTNIAVEGSVDEVLVGESGGKAINTTIIAGSIKNRIYVGDFGEAINTNIAVEGSVGNVYVGYQGKATNTNITLGNGGGGPINVYGPNNIGKGATNTNIVISGGSATINVKSGAVGTTCNGVLYNSAGAFQCPP